MYPTSRHLAPNGMRFTAFDNTGTMLAEEVFYSVGGGFIVSEAERTAESLTSSRKVPYPFRSSAELLATAKEHNLTSPTSYWRTKSPSSTTRPSLSTDPKEFLPQLQTLGAHPSQSYREGGKNKLTAPQRSSCTIARRKIRTSILAIWQTMQQCTERASPPKASSGGSTSAARPPLAERLNTIGSKDP